MKFKSVHTAPFLPIIAMLLLCASRFLDFRALSYQGNISLAIVVLEILVILVPTAFYSKLKGDGYTKRLRFSTFGIEKLLITFLAAVCIILGTTIIKVGLGYFGFSDDVYVTYKEYLSGTNPGVLYSLITLAIVPSICEEILFRSVLCAEYEERGAFNAVIVSSILYGLFGLSFGYFPVYFFVGIILALLMYLTRSVFASILCHLICNIFELSAGATIKTLVTKPQNVGFLLFALTAVFLICLMLFFGECERIYYGYAASGQNPEYIKENIKSSFSSFFEIILTPAFLGAVLVFIVISIHFM